MIVQKKNQNFCQKTTIEGNEIVFYYNKKQKKLPLYKICYDNTIRIFEPFKALWSMLINKMLVKPLPFTLSLNDTIQDICTGKYLLGHMSHNHFILWNSYDNIIDDNIIDDDKLIVNVGDDGYVLHFTDSNSQFDISWSSDEDVIISFYTTYNGLEFNAYPVFDIDGNIASYSGKNGKFRIINCYFMCVRTNKQANIELYISDAHVKTYCNLETSHFIFPYKGCQYSFPVEEINKKKLVTGNLQDYMINTLKILSKSWPIDFCKEKYNTSLYECNNTLYECNNVVPKIFTDEYLGIWSILSEVGKFDYFGPEFTTKFQLPASSETRLSGTPFLTDESSVVRVFSFIAENGDGPIIDDGGGFILNTVNDALNFRIKWKINKNSINLIPNVKIGFYSSNRFTYGITNKLYLICGNKGPSIFNANKCNNYKGSFTCSNINIVYVAADNDVTINLTVQIIVPKKIVTPLLTIGKPVFQYYKTTNKKIIPVTKLTLLDQTTLAAISKPLPCFKEEAKYVNKYLNDTALSITLFDQATINDVSVKQLAPIIFTLGKEINSTAKSAYSHYYTILNKAKTDIDGDPKKFVTFTYNSDYTGFGIPTESIPLDDLVYATIEFTITVRFPPLISQGDLLIIPVFSLKRRENEFDWPILLSLVSTGGGRLLYINTTRTLTPIVHPIPVNESVTVVVPYSETYILDRVNSGFTPDLVVNIRGVTPIDADRLTITYEKVTLEFKPFQPP